MKKGKDKKMKTEGQMLEKDVDILFADSSDDKTLNRSWRANEAYMEMLGEIMLAKV